MKYIFVSFFLVLFSLTVFSADKGWVRSKNSFSTQSIQVNCVQKIINTIPFENCEIFDRKTNKMVLRASIVNNQQPEYYNPQMEAISINEQRFFKKVGLQPGEAHLRLNPLKEKISDPEYRAIRAVGYLDFRDFGGQARGGTAIILGEATLITAAHNLCDRETGEWKTDIFNFYPDLHFSPDEVLEIDRDKTVIAGSSRVGVCNNAYTRSRDNDIAIVKLKQSIFQKYPKSYALAAKISDVETEIFAENSKGCRNIAFHGDLEKNVPRLERGCKFSGPGTGVSQHTLGTYYNNSRGASGGANMYCNQKNDPNCEFEVVSMIVSGFDKDPSCEFEKCLNYSVILKGNPNFEHAYRLYYGKRSNP